jgi:hypothetical protein
MINEKIEISVNCMTSYNSEVVPTRFCALLTKLIHETKESNKWVMMPEVDHDDGFMKGSRYHDTDRCVNVILGNMYRNCRSSVNEYLGRNPNGHYSELNNSVDSYFAKYIQKVRHTDAVKWVNSCLKYSGSCDHWYTYEKDWGN